MRRGGRERSPVVVKISDVCPGIYRPDREDFLNHYPHSHPLQAVSYIQQPANTDCTKWKCINSDREIVEILFTVRSLYNAGVEEQVKRDRVIENRDNLKGCARFG